MTTAEPAAPVEAMPPTADVPKVDALEEGNLKRKLSHDDELSGGSPKRPKQEDDIDDTRPRKPPPSPDRNRARDPAPQIIQERRASAAQEEKKRSKRLFGGLLTTIGQTTTNTQQKRRQEIERRQQERLQKQEAEGEKIRAERVAKLNGVRLAEQIAFEEDVMRARHSKTLSMAQFLRTRAKPHICYLPWKTTEEQERTIDRQIEEAKLRIRRENESFKERTEKHVRQYGPSSRPPKAPMEASAAAPDAENPAYESPQNSKEPESKSELEPEPEPVAQPEPKAEIEAKPADEDAGGDSHDESGDVLEEGDEDMVIY